MSFKTFQLKDPMDSPKLSSLNFRVYTLIFMSLEKKAYKDAVVEEMAMLIQLVPITKLRLLPVVDQHSCRADLMEIFLDNNILTVFKVRSGEWRFLCFGEWKEHVQDWLSPLSDKRSPNIEIRESVIVILQQVNIKTNCIVAFS